MRKIKNVFKRKVNKKPLDSLLLNIAKIVKQFILIILPAIAIAAFIEAYISKYLLDKFI